MIKSNFGGYLVTADGTSYNLRLRAAGYRCGYLRWTKHGPTCGPPSMRARPRSSTTPGGGDRRHQPVQQPAAAGELFRAEPADAAVGTGSRPSRSHQQDRPQSCSRHAGRGGLGSGQGDRSTACFFRAHPHPARPLDRGGGRGSEAHCALLAFVDEGRGLPGRARRCSPTRPARCNFKPDIRNRKVAGVDQPMPTTSSRYPTARC
ncbi:hypothetical protein ACVJGD_007867 [Bradyrhizobium sp. USDA 10063]